MAGNVWEWCNDWYRPDYYSTLAKQKVVTDPQGPPDSFDPDEPFAQKQVVRGGSFYVLINIAQVFVLQPG